MNKVFGAVVLSGALGLTLAVAVPASATPITYDVALSDTGNTAFSGTLQVTFNTTPTATFTDYHSDVTALSIALANGDTFNFTDSNASLTAFEFQTFTPTITIRDITFSDTTGVSPSRISFMSTGQYVVDYNNLQTQTFGVFGTATAVTTVTSVAPEPASLLLMGTGLAAVGLCLRKRRATR